MMKGVKMKKLILLVLAFVICVAFTGCAQKGTYEVPTKTGGGGQQQPFIPAGNSNGGQYLHLDKK